MSYEIADLLDMLHLLKKLQLRLYQAKQAEVARSLDPGVQLLEKEIELKTVEYVNYRKW